MLAPIPLSVRSPRSLAGPVCALDSLAIAGPSLGLLLTVEIEIHCSVRCIGPRATSLDTQCSLWGGLTVGRIILSSAHQYVDIAKIAISAFKVYSQLFNV